MHLKTRHFFSLLLIFSFSMTNIACDTQPEEQAFGDWDVDDDDYIDQEEFNEVFLASDYVSQWGLDEDTPLTYGDLYDVNFNLWDFNNDMVLTPQEWRNAIDTYYPDYDEVVYGAFEEWDLNDDNEVSKSEYMEAVLDTDLMKDWDIDQDETISEEEFAQAVYEYWDTDGDGYIEAVEYEEWEPIFSDM